VSSSTTLAQVYGINSTSTSTVSIQNNTIGAIAAGSTLAIGYKVYGINTAGAAGNYTISGNTIGSTSTANSITAGISGTTTTGVCTFTGISNAATGTNSITGNTIQNCSSYGTGASVLNGILNTGGLSTSTLAITTNNILNLTGTGTGQITGISNTAAVATLNINSNVLYGFTTSSGSAAFNGIVNTGLVTTAINMNSNSLGNSTGGLITYSAANSGNLYGIYNNDGVGSTSTTLSITGNNFQGITNSTAGTNSQTYIWENVNTNSNPATVNISSNTFTNLAVNTTGTGGAASGINFINDYSSVPATGSKTISSNSIVTAFSNSSACAYYIYNCAASSATGSTITSSSNNFSNINLTGASTMNGWNSIDGGSPTKIFNSNTFSNWTCGSGNALVLTVSYVGGTTSSISNNTISGITGTGTVTGITIGNIGTPTTMNISTNSVSGLTGTTVTAINDASAATTTNINANTIYTLSSSTNKVATGLMIAGGVTNNIYGNTIYGVSTVTGSAYGLSFVTAAATTANYVYTNKIYGMTATGAVAAALTIAGIYEYYNSPLNVFYNNTIGLITAPAATLDNTVVGMYLALKNTTSSTTNDVYYNSIYLSASGVTNFGSSGIYQTNNSTSTYGSLDMRNNIIINNSTPSGTGLSVAFRRSAAYSSTANYLSTSNNNLFYAGTPGANNLIYSDGTNSEQTLAAFQSLVSTRETNSVTENTTFQSIVGSNANFLRIAFGTSTYAESGAQAITTPVNINTDYWGITRPFPSPVNGGTAPDIGASEFDGFGPVPTIALSTNTISGIGNVTQGTTNNPIYSFAIAVTTANANLTGLNITTTGTYASADITNLKVWYQSSTLGSTFTGTGTLLSTYTTPGAAGSKTFPLFTSQSILSGATGYIFITADVPCGATVTDNIAVNAVTASNTTFTRGTPTGTPAAGSTVSITAATPNCATSLAASTAPASSVLTWVAPTGCYSDVMMVVSPAANTGGTPTGSGYTGNLAYGSGAAFGNGYVVYEGTTSSQTVTGLTNGTTYYVKWFTRLGTTWVACSEITVTPAVTYCTNTGGTSSYYINSVSTAGGITNISQSGLTFPAGGYNFYSSLSSTISQIPGGTFTVSLAESGGTDGFGIWVDWNQNGSFADAGEQMWLPGGYVSSVTTTTLTVPSGATLGNTRMRIVGSENGTSSPAACTGSTYTDCLDYIFNVATPATPTIALSTNSISGIGNVSQGTTNNPIYSFAIGVTTASATLTGLNITTTGTYASADITNLKVWYQSSTLGSTFTGTGTLLSTFTTPGVAGSKTFPLFTSQSILSGATGYIFITADVPCGATVTDNIAVNAVTASNTTFTLGTPTGTPAAGSTVSVIAATPNCATSLAAASGAASAVLTWVAPTGCYSDVMVVVSPAANTGGTPTGSGYSGSLTYGSGAAFGNGYVVYEGTTSGQTVTGLTNGTTYYVKWFTRLGTTWVACSEITVTPAVVYCTPSAGTSDGISGVVFNTISNLGTGLNSYTNYTSTYSTNVTQGSSYTLTVYVNTGGNYTNYQKVWIDWNQDGIFNTTAGSSGGLGEEYTLGTATNVTNGVTSLCPLTIVVPAGATPGTTRMRVSSCYTGATYTTSCATGIDGEFEDYGIVVVASVTPTITLSSNTISAGNIAQGSSSDPIYSFAISPTVASASLTGLNIVTTGTYTTSDFTNMKAWYSASSTFNASTATLLSTLTAYTTAGTQTFPSFVSQTIANGATGYIFITCDLPCTATVGDAIAVNAVTGSNTTFVLGTATGTPSAGNTQTISSGAPAIGSLSATAVCNTGTSTLSTTGSTGTVEWYDAATEGNYLGSGTSITSPSISAATTYYAEAYSLGSAVSGQGKSAPTGTTTKTTNSGLQFTALSEFMLNSVNVYPAGTGNITIALYNSSGIQIQGTVINVTSGSTTTPFTANLGWDIPVGTGYYIQTSGTMATGLVRETGQTFPMAVSTVASITDGETGGVTSTTYFYFYGWNVSPIGCSAGSRTSVVVPYANPTITAATSATAVCQGVGGTTPLTYSATSGSPTTYSIVWNSAALTAGFSNVTTATLPSSQINITVPSGAAAATYTGTLSVQNSTGCSGTGNTFTVTVNALPTAPTVTPTTVTICNGSIQSIVASGSSGGSTTVMSQNFDAVITGNNGLPTGWATTNNGGWGYDWTNTSNFPSAFDDWNGGAQGGYGGTGNCVYFIAGDLNAGTIGDLTAPSMDLSSYSSATLTFYIYNSDATDVLKVYAKQGSGGTYAQVGVTYNTAYTSWTQITINLNAYSGTGFNAVYLEFQGTCGNQTSNIAIDNVVVTGTSTVAYTWTPITALYENSGATTAYTTGANYATVYAKPSATTTYTATATNGNGCTATGTSVITVNQPSIAPTGISGTTTICNGGSGTTLTATGGTLGTGATYQWGTGTTIGTGAIGGATSITYSPSPTSSTTYWVSVTGTTPCGSPSGGWSQLVTVEQPSVAPTSLVSSAGSLCNGASVTLTQTGGSLGTGAVWQWYSDANFTVPVGSTLTSSNASLAVSPTATTTYYLRAINGTSPCAVSVPVATPSTVSVTVTVTPNAWIGVTSSDWSVGSNWCSGIPPVSTTDVTIPSAGSVPHSPVIGLTASYSAVCNNITLASGASLTMSSSYSATLTISAGAAFTNNASTSAFAGGTGTVYFAGAGSIAGSSATTFNNLTISTGTVTLSTVPTIDGIMQINGGNLSVAPIYGPTSTLFYNVSYGRYVEWNATGVGTIGSTPGYPNNVTINTGTLDVYNSASGVARALAGTLTVNSGAIMNFNGMNAAFTVGAGIYVNGGTINMNTMSGSLTTGTYLDIESGGAFNMNTMSAAVTIGSYALNKGTLALSTASGGDMYVAGNWTRAAAATFTPNARAVFFNGSGTEVVTVTGGGTETFNYLLINGSGTMQIATGTTVSVNYSSGLTLGSTNTTSTIDLHGQTMILYGGGNLNINSGNTYITSSSGTGTLQILSNTTTVANGGTTGMLTFQAGTVLDLQNGFNSSFNSTTSSSYVTINGTLQIDGGGYVPAFGTGYAPIYGTNSLLLYNIAGSYTAGQEWYENTYSQPGVPFNVTLESTTSLNFSGEGYQHELWGNLTINTGTTMSLNATTYSGHNGDLNIKGNWINSGTFNCNGREVTFLGLTAQTLTGATTFDYLQMYNSAGLILNNNATVNSQLILTSGVITTGTNKVVVLSSSSTSVTGNSSTSYINGNIRRYVTASGNYDLPVGTASNYQLANIVFTSGLTSTTYLDAKFNNSTPIAPVPTSCVINNGKIGTVLSTGSWTITPDAEPNSGATYTASLYMTGITTGLPSSFVDAHGHTITPADQIGLVKKDAGINSGNWTGCGLMSGSTQPYGTQVQTTQATTSNTATVVRSGIPSFSDYGIGVEQNQNWALPVQLIYFAAVNDNNNAALTWATASEVNNAYFEIDRSLDGVTFDSIGQVAGNGNSEVTINYAYNDPDISLYNSPVLYYRLKQVDFDGNFTYSNIAAVNVADVQQVFHIISTYPNPFSDHFSVAFFSPASQAVRMSVYDVRGALVSEETINAEIGMNVYTIPNPSHLASGFYTMNVSAGEKNFGIKMLKEQ
jgi:hypothetical protein